MKTRIKAKITFQPDNFFKFDNSPLAVSYLAHTFKKDTEVELTVKKWRDKRSNQANKYYWGMIVKLLSEHTGYTKTEMHEALKFKFLQKPGTQNLPTVLSTTKLNTKEFCEYCEKIKQWASLELSVYIPDPNDFDILEQNNNERQSFS